VRKVKIGLKYLGIGTGVIVFFIIFYLSSAYLLSQIPTDVENDKDEISIYILSNGVHTDLVVPIKAVNYNWTEFIKYETTKSTDTTYKFIAFGWGDKGFYLETPTWDDLTFNTAFKAGFGLSSSAIHATFYKRMKINSDCKEIKVSNQQYLRLTNYIKSSFQTDNLKLPIHIKTDAVYGLNDAFFEANGKYNLFKTCNT
jgi:uncharacterized protein (TIGR02117 family)